MSNAVKSQHVISDFAPPHPSVRSYISGFLVCIALTLAAYGAAVLQPGGKKMVIAVVGGLAVVQFVVQLFKFLHIGQEFRPRWKLAVFILMLCITVIIVGGSLWIMNNLNYRMMHSPALTNEYVQGQDGL